MNPAVRQLLLGGERRDARSLARLIAAAANPVDQELAMPSPPTITTGAANAASVISGAVSVAWNDSRLTYSTKVEVAGAVSPDSTIGRAAYLDTAATGATASMRGLYSSVSFATAAAQFEVRTKGFTRHRVWVTGDDGVSYCLTEQLMASDGNMYRTLYDFGGSELRRIVVQFANGFGGLSIASTEAVHSWAPDSPKLLIVGDSFTEGTGAVSLFQGYATRLAELLGCYATHINCGIGGTGYVATNAGTKKNALAIVQNSVIDNAPDAVVWAHALNDGSDVSSNAAQCFDAVRSSLPGCVQIVFGAFQPRSLASAGTRTTEIQAVCAGMPRLRFIDNSSSGSNPEITGTGRVGATTGVGNSDWVIGTDGTHPTGSTNPTGDGHKYLAEYRDTAIRAALGL